MSKYTVKATSQFRKDYKLAKKRGNWEGHRECHVQPDWLLVYYLKDDVLVLTLSRTGTHSDLFGK